MKKWRETQLVFERLAELVQAGRRVALATVVGVQGSVYRREGAKMLVAEDGSHLGNVSGGCLEADVQEVALQVLKYGQPQLRRYCSSGNDIEAWDLGLGCDGQVDVYIEPALSDRAHERAQLAAERPFVIRTPLAVTPGPGKPDVFVDVFEPPPKLILIGAGDDAVPFARLGCEMGFRVIVVDRRPGLLTPERFPPPIKRVESEPDRLAQLAVVDGDSHVVVMTHRFLFDAQYVRALVSTPASYIGILGPRARTERLLEPIAAAAAIDRERIHGPVGLDIGGDGAEQIALAVIAEILSVRSRRSAQPLRERSAPIHADAV